VRRVNQADKDHCGCEPKPIIDRTTYQSSPRYPAMPLILDLTKANTSGPKRLSCFYFLLFSIHRDAYHTPTTHRNPPTIPIPIHPDCSAALAQPRHQRPASPPPVPSSASAAATHRPQFSPIRDMIVIREILGEEYERYERLVKINGILRT